MKKKGIQGILFIVELFAKVKRCGFFYIKPSSESLNVMLHLVNFI